MKKIIFLVILLITISSNNAMQLARNNIQQQFLQRFRIGADHSAMLGTLRPCVGCPQQFEQQKKENYQITTEQIEENQKKINRPTQSWCTKILPPIFVIFGIVLTGYHPVVE